MPLNDPLPLAALDADLVLRLGSAAMVGLLLGFDREVRGHSAGLRTHGLVCLAAAALTVSAIAFHGSMAMPNADPMRIYDAVGTFVAIIGAGLIFFSGGKVHNLTTAAHLFLTAVIGIACGAAQWPVVAVTVPLGLAMLVMLRMAEDKRRGRAARSGDDGAQD
jgi:putative Mg2+ transporter-C (MgtC) family protein